MTSVEHDPTIPTPPTLAPYKPDGRGYTSADLMIQRIAAEHAGRFYFLRAFWTTMGILLSWTVWILIPIAVATVVILLLGGLGAVIPDDDPVEPSGVFACDPTTELC